MVTVQIPISIIQNSVNSDSIKRHYAEQAIIAICQKAAGLLTRETGK